MVGRRHEEAAPVCQGQGVGPGGRAKAWPFARRGALQGDDGRGVLPLDQPQEISPRNRQTNALLEKGTCLAGTSPFALKRLFSSVIPRRPRPAIRAARAC